MDKKQVSSAAVELGMPQPAVSRALSKLRKHFNDPLFVRAQYGMEPTPFAVELSPYIDEMVMLYENSLARGLRFDPATSNRIFRVAGSEVGHVLLFSRLMPEIFRVAPNIQLHAVPLGLNTLRKELESGGADMAFGAYPKLYSGVHERTLYKERYVCLVRRDHPSIGEHMTLDDFNKGYHILMSAQGLGHIHEQIETQIAGACENANLKVVAHSFLAAALLAEKSDCIVTLPSGAAQALDHRQQLRVLEPPIKLPSFDIKLYWHERYHQDTAHQWFRGLIYELFEDTEVILEQEVT